MVQTQSSVTHQTVASIVQVLKQITPLSYSKCWRASCCNEDNIHTPDPDLAPASLSSFISYYFPLTGGPPATPVPQQLQDAPAPGSFLLPLAENNLPADFPMAGFLSFK